LRRQKNLPPTAVNQKHPVFGRFSPSPFERHFPPPPKSLCGAKNKESDSLIRKRPRGCWMASHLVGSLIPCSEGCVGRYIQGPGLSLAWTAWLRLRCNTLTLPMKGVGELAVCSSYSSESHWYFQPCVAEDISPRPISASGAAYYRKLAVAAVLVPDLLEIYLLGRWDRVFTPCCWGRTGGPG
jgi:hypothetical protein